MSNLVRVVVALAIAHCTLPGLALATQADEEALLLLYGSEEMITIATGRRQPISKAPAIATVITADDIRAMGATDLDEVLETVAGLHVARDPIGYNPLYTVRGVFSFFNPQVLVLINDIPVTNLFFGNRNLVWGGMPVESIARIEVIRGPGSAVYGADAFAGVINIITKSRGDIERPEAGVRRGSFDTWDAWGLYGGDWGGFDVALMLEYRDTEGHRRVIEADAQTHLDQSLGTSASHAPGPVNLMRETFDARIDVSRGDWRFRGGLQRRYGGSGAGVSQALDPTSRSASDRWNADLTYHNPELAKEWDFRAQVSFLSTSQEVKRDLILFPPGATLPVGSDGNINLLEPAGFQLFPDGLIGNPEIFEQHYRLGLSAFYTGLKRHLLRVGAGLNYGEIDKVREVKNYGIDPATGEPLPPGSPVIDVTDTPFVFLRPDDRRNYYAFAQDVWTFAEDWELTTGLRYDYYSDFGSTINPRLALVWSTRRDLTTKLLYGRAFRAPSFAETRNINNPVALGNPDLRPETIHTGELAFDYRPTPDLRLGLGLFRYRWQDIIEFVPDPDATTRTAQNAGEQTGTGFELEMEWRPLTRLRLLGNYALQRSRDEITRQDAGYAPRHQAYLRSEWGLHPNWLLTPQITYIGTRARPAGDPRPALEGYTTVDLTLRHRRPRDDWELAFSVRNLFDADAREPSPAGVPVPSIPDDLPLAGRSYFGELRYRF
jgi:outer membrane receptor protein involved in Fe transport